MAFLSQNHGNGEIQSFIDQRFAEATKQSNLTFIGKTLKKVAFVGALAHIAFIFLFTTLGIAELAFINMFSVLIWTFAYYTCSKNHLNTTIAIIVIEIVLHAFIVTIFIGSQAGFHFYLWPAMGLLLVTTDKQNKLFTIFSVCIVGLFIYLETTKNIDYSYGFESALLPISWLNIICSAIPFIFAIKYFQNKRLDSDKNLFELANTDEFTHLYNRRFIYSLLRDQDSALVHIKNYAIILCDIDNFNQINKLCGYAEGDNMILCVKQTLDKYMSGNDLLARWGGQEFLMIVDNTHHQAIDKMINSIQLSLCRDIVKPDEAMADLALSYGVAFHKNGDRFAQVLQRADKLLYQAKQDGKDRAAIEDQACR